MLPTGYKFALRACFSAEASFWYTMPITYKGGMDTLKEQLINDVLQFLTGKLPAEHATDLRLYLYYQLAEYDVTKKCTDVAVREEKTYMDYLYIVYGRSENGRPER